MGRLVSVLLALRGEFLKIWSGLKVHRVLGGRFLGQMSFVFIFGFCGFAEVD